MFRFYFRTTSGITGTTENSLYLSNPARDSEFFVVRINMKLVKMQPLMLYPPMAKSHTLPLYNQASSSYDNFLVESEITVFKIFTVCCIDLKLIEYEVINNYH